MRNINLETLFFQNFVPVLFRDAELLAHLPPTVVPPAEENIDLPELPDDRLGGDSFLLGPAPPYSISVNSN